MAEVEKCAEVCVRTLLLVSRKAWKIIWPSRTAEEEVKFDSSTVTRKFGSLKELFRACMVGAV